MSRLHDLLLAAALAVAVALAHRLIPPRPGPPPALKAEAEAALSASWEPAADAGATSVRVYDVRDLMRQPLEFDRDRRARLESMEAAWTGPEPVAQDLFGGHYTPPAPEMVVGLDMADLVRERVRRKSPADWPVNYAAGRLVVTATDAEHARIAAFLAALRLVERVPREAVDAGVP